MSKSIVDKKPGKKKQTSGKRSGDSLGGRPKLKIDAQAVFDLAAIDCTVEEIASVLRCSIHTIYDRFSEPLHRGHREGQRSLKRKMHEVAFSGDTKMLIWLSKQRLGYKEQWPESTGNIQFNVYINEVPRNQIGGPNNMVIEHAHLPRVEGASNPVLEHNDTSSS